MHWMQKERRQRRETRISKAQEAYDQRQADLALSETLYAPTTQRNHSHQSHALRIWLPKTPDV